jgi:hypothetical protein
MLKVTGIDKRRSMCVCVSASCCGRSKRLGMEVESEEKVQSKEKVRANQ